MLVGAARQIINCDAGHTLCGYGSDYPVAGVHDDLSVTALFLDDGQRQAVLLNYDSLGFAAITIDLCRAAVGTALGISPQNVFLTCTHTHSAPDAIDCEPFAPYERRHSCQRDYLKQIREWTVAAARAAQKSAEECELRYNYATAAENMNRRYTFPDRRILYIPDNKQLAGLSNEYVDRELGILAFRKKGKPNSYQAIITNYTCHPLCVGNTSNLLSADFQGVLRRRIEETFEGSLCLSTTGAAGDNHPLFPEGGFVAMEAMGNRLAEMAISRTYDAVAVDGDDQLRLAYPRVTMAIKDEQTLQMLPSSAARSPGWLPRQTQHHTRVSLLGIGPILFAGVPGEMVSALGAMLKWSSPFLKTYVLYSATDYVGYIPAANQYHWGGYEADTSPFAAQAGVKLVADIVKAAYGLMEQQPLRLKTLDVPLMDGRAK